MMLAACERGWMSAVHGHVYPLGEILLCVNIRPLFCHKFVHIN